MKNFLSIALATVLMFIAPSVFASPQVSGGPLTHNAREHRIDFDDSTADSKSIPVGGSCQVSVVYTGTGTVSLYQVESGAVAATSGTLIRTFSASTTAPTDFVPGLPVAKAVASTSGTDGTFMTVRCSYTDLTNSSQIDADGDGFYEYLSFPFDYDGDGSGTTLCTAEEVPDPACLFAGEKVWRDAVDDVNAAVDQLAVGGQIEVAGDWVFPIRPRVCSEDANVSCDADAQCSGTCVLHQGYTPSKSWPSGAARSVAGSFAQVLPTLSKTGMTFTGSGMDINNSFDNNRSGTWFVDDRNDDSQAGATAGNIALWGIALGAYRDDGQSYGDGYADADTAGASGDVQIAYEGGDMRLCIESTFADLLVPGDRLSVQSGVYLESGSVELNYPVAMVTDVYNNSSTVTEENVAPCNGDPPDMRPVALSISDWDSAAAFGDTTLVLVDKNMWTADITFEKANWMPQNPFIQNNYGNDNPVVCGAPTDWDGTATRSAQPADCDTGAGVGIFSGQGHTVQRIASHHHSNLAAGVYDGQDACYGCTFKENYIGAGRVAASIFDTGTGWHITDNYFELGPNQNASTATAIRNLGDNVRIERNTFVGMGRLQCSTEPAVACQVNGECAGSCYPSNSAMFSFKNGSVWFVDNYIYGGTGGTNATGAIMNIDTSDFTMTGNRFMNTHGSNQYQISISNSSNNINIHNNQFGYHRLSTGNANNGGNIFITEGATNVSITDNQFTWDDPADGDDYWISPIRLTAGAEDSLLTTQLVVDGNSMTGYLHLMTDTGSGYLPQVYPSTGSRENTMNGNRLSEEGDVAFASIATCDSHADTGVAYYVTDSDLCVAGSGSGIRCACLWDGAGVTSGDFNWTPFDITP